MTAFGRDLASNGACPELSVGDLARLREETYRLLSQAFLYPEPERVRELGAASEELVENEEALAHFAFLPLWRDLQSALRGQERQPAVERAGAFVRLFSAGPQGVLCPPYESAYRNGAGQPSGWLLAQVEATYAAVGLGASSQLKDLPDHVAVELEFMAILCGREGEAWERRAGTAASRLLRTQRGFLRDHLGRWLPAFARRVGQVDAGGCYATISSCADAFAAYDVDMIEALLAGVCAHLPSMERAT